MVSNAAMIKTIRTSAQNILVNADDLDKGKITDDEFTESCEVLGRNIASLSRKIKEQLAVGKRL